LGNYCLLAMAMQSLGLRRCAYPLDYTRSSARGVIDLFATNFRGFLSGTPVPHAEYGTTFQNTAWGGSFWHHDISNPEVKAAMERRVDRLLGNTSVPKSRPRIFCRAVNSTSELGLTMELLATLQATYTGPVKLLILIEDQLGEGPIGLFGQYDVLFYRVNQQYSFVRSRQERMLGFVAPLACAIKVWAGEPVPMSQVSTVLDVMSLCDTMDGGHPANSLFCATLSEPAQRVCPPPTTRRVPAIIPDNYGALGNPLPLYEYDYEDKDEDWLSLHKLMPENLGKLLEMHLSFAGLNRWPSAELAWHDAGLEPC